MCVGRRAKGGEQGPGFGALWCWLEGTEQSHLFRTRWVRKGLCSYHEDKGQEKHPAHGTVRLCRSGHTGVFSCWGGWHSALAWIFHVAFMSQALWPPRVWGLWLKQTRRQSAGIFSFPLIFLDLREKVRSPTPSGASTASETALLDIVFKVVNHEQTSEGHSAPMEPLLTQWLSSLLPNVASASRNLILLGSSPARANNGSFLCISSKSLVLLYRVLENGLYWASHFLLHTIISSNPSLRLAFLRGNFELARLWGMPSLCVINAAVSPFLHSFCLLVNSSSWPTKWISWCLYGGDSQLDQRSWVNRQHLMEASVSPESMRELAILPK